MRWLKCCGAAVFAVLAIAAVSTSAEANYRCGYDRYGYHPPSWRGCYGHRSGWGFYPAYGFYPEGSYYAIPRYPVRYPRYIYPTAVVGYRCYYDNGYDLRVHRICVRW